MRCFKSKDITLFCIPLHYSWTTFIYVFNEWFWTLLVVTGVSLSLLFYLAMKLLEPAQNGERAFVEYFSSVCLALCALSVPESPQMV